MAIEATGRDISGWLDDTYVMWHHRTHGDIPARYMGNDGDTISVSKIADGVLHTPTAVSRANLSCHWPRLGCINVPGRNFAVYFSRIPARQWRRSLCMRYLRIFTPQTWLLVKQGTDIHVDFHDAKLIEQLFSPTYPTLQQARRLLNSKHVSVAITNCVTLVKEGPETLLVYYRKDVVGRLTGNELRVDKEGTIERRVLRALGQEVYVA